MSCTSVFSQYAAIAALEGRGIRSITVAEFRRRRDIIVAGVDDLPGVSCLEPQGALYVFPNITETCETSADLEAKDLKDAGVAALSGTASARAARFPAIFLRELGRDIRLALEAIRAQLG